MHEINHSFYSNLDFKDGYKSEGPSNWTNNNYDNDFDTRLEIQDFFRFIYAVFSLIVWSKGKKCSNIACLTYFKLLAFTDILSLIACGYAVVMIVGVDMVQHAALRIRPNFLINFAPQLSTWLVVFISIEKLQRVTFPFVYSPNGSRTRVKIAVSVLILVLTRINSHSFLFELRETRSSQFCYIDTQNRFWYFFLYRISSVWTLCIVSFCLIVMGNILILV